MLIVGCLDLVVGIDYCLLVVCFASWLLVVFVVVRVVVVSSVGIVDCWLRLRLPFRYAVFAVAVATALCDFLEC